MRESSHFDLPEFPLLKALTYALLGGLFAAIAWLAVIAEPPVRSSLPATPTDQADVTEKRLRLADGRTVLCLIFPGTVAASCEWGAAR